MTERRTFAPDGQRNGDAFLGRAVKLIAIAGAVATGFAFVNHTLGEVSDAVVTTKLHSAQIDSVKADIAAVKTQSAGTLYLACVTFAESHPVTQVPTFCNGATRANTR